jgi:DNA-binding XRE family transcriptional regulator
MPRGEKTPADGSGRCSDLGRAEGDEEGQGVSMASPKWFAGRLRELRLTRGWTQRQLAQAAGTTLRTVAHWERGACEPLWSNALALADALEVSVAAFAVEPAELSPQRPHGRPRKAPPAG